MTAGLDLWVGGYPLSTVCAYDSLSWTTRYPYGDYDLSFHVATGGGFRHPAFAQGNTAQPRLGGLPLFTGDMAEPDYDTGNMAATGVIRRGENYRAFYWDTTDLALLPTWDPDQAVDDAISPVLASGRTAIGWTRATMTIPSLRTAADDIEPMQLLELLDLATKRGYGTPYMAWGKRLQMLTQPFTAHGSSPLTPGAPKWHVHPNVVDLGELAGDDYATRIFLTYLDSGIAPPVYNPNGATYTVGTKTTYDGHIWQAQVLISSSTPDSAPSAGYQIGGTDVWKDLGEVNMTARVDTGASTVRPYREVTLDVTNLGPMTSTEANAIAQQALAAGLEPVYSTDIPVTPLTVTDAGGQPCNPLLVRAGDLVRVWGAVHPRLGHQFVDIIAGEVTVSDAETSQPSAVIKPWQKPAITYSEVAEASLNALRASQIYTNRHLAA